VASVKEGVWYIVFARLKPLEEFKPQLFDAIDIDNGPVDLDNGISATICDDVFGDFGKFIDNADGGALVAEDWNQIERPVCVLGVAVAMHDEREFVQTGASSFGLNVLDQRGHFRPDVGPCILSS